MNPRTTATALLAALAAINLYLASSGFAAESGATTNRPPLVELEATQHTLSASWKWLTLNQKQPVGAAAEFPDIKYGRSAVETTAPRSLLVAGLFQGSILRITGGKGPDHGMADVIVDGKRMATFDAYGPAQVCDQVLCTHHPNETCGTVFWTDINHRFLLYHPDEAKYADQIETALYNVMLGVQTPEGNIRYHTVHVARKEGGRYGNTCCEVFGSPLFASLPQYLYSVAADGVYVNLYAPSSITTKQLTLKTTTDFPANGKVEIKAEGAGKLRLRIPGWVDADVPVSVNGKVVATGKPGSYVTLDKPAGTVTFELPMKFRTVLYTGADQNPDHDTYSLVYGPVLLALVGADDLDIPAKDLPGKLKPVDGKPLHFTVAGKDGVHYQPYWQIQTETFNCFPTLR